MRKNKNNKYHDFPPRINIEIGECCSLAQCSRQIRKAARPFVLQKVVNHSLGFPAFFPALSPGMEFSGLNGQTGEQEVFRVISVPMANALFSGMKRVK